MPRWDLVLAAALWTAGCSSSLHGGPSLTLISRQDIGARYAPVTDAPVERAECFNNLLFLGFFGNSGPSHTSAIDHLLDAYDADILLDATVTNEVWPFVLFNRRCVRVWGVPARRIEPAAGASS